MDPAPVVSVALASYNGERYIAEQVLSIVNQSRRPDEVIVSDGGSSDNTVGIVRELLAQSPAIPSRVIADGARLGVGANFQRAIAATTGTLIALSDQDDVWHPERIERAVASFDDPAVLLASGNARLIDSGGASLPVDLFDALGVGRRELVELNGTEAFALLVRRNLVTGATVMFRRQLLAAAEPFPVGWVHDEWLAILAASIGRLSVDPVPLIDYRQHTENAIGVSAPTFGYRVRRMLIGRGDRYPVLAQRSAELMDRLDSVEGTQRWRTLAAGKAEFEAIRARYDRRRVRRVFPVLAAFRSGAYDLFSSQGRLDVLRDILQAE